MNIPGFTAEASLFNVSTRYQATAEASFYGGLVQPAQIFSDSTTVSGGPIFHLPQPCLKYVCWPRVAKSVSKNNLNN